MEGRRSVPGLHGPAGPAAARRPGPRRHTLPTARASGGHATPTTDVRHPLLDVGRAEPVRDLRPQAGRPGRIPRPLPPDPVNGPRHGRLRAVPAAGGPGPAAAAGPLATPHPIL